MATASSSFTTPTLSSISDATAGLVTISTDHGWQVGDVVRFQGLTEMTELNGVDSVIASVPNSTTFTIGDTSAFTAESTGGPDTCFLVVDVSGYLRTGAKGEDVTVALSGTYSSTVRLERSVTPDESAWEKVLPSKNSTWNTDNDTVSEIYITQRDNETLRLVVSDLTPTGTVVASLTDSAKVIKSFVDDDGNELFELTEDGVTFRVAVTQDAVQTYVLAHIHTGVETHTGAETHSDAETHSGDEIHIGRETFVRVDATQVPEMSTVAAPATMANSATMSAAQQISRIIEGTPTSGAAYTTRTGTQIEAALPATVATGDCFYQSIINLATGAGLDITMTAGSSGVTIVGDPVVDAQDADGNNAVGHFLYRRSASNTFIVYRIG